ncbi:MAG: Hsp33 family molecular chaperone [Hyphomicrobiaceae bacterium]
MARGPDSAREARRDYPDDIVLPFGTIRSRMAGRIVRLGAVVDRVLSGHDYPVAVSEVLGEALALTALLGQPIKAGGRLILQTKTDGPLRFLVTQYESPGALRGYAAFDAQKIAALAAGGGRIAPGALLGQGRMALTVDPGGEQESHQGIIALEGDSLAEAANDYFRQSEQLPTFIALAVARHMTPPTKPAIAGKPPDRGWRWRAGGLVLQHVPVAGGDPRPDETPEERDARLDGSDDEDWVRVSTLAATVEAHELTDPTLSPERLLLRLFHEEGVRVSPEVQLEARCRCSRDRIKGFLDSFTPEDRQSMREPDGAISVTCEFCSTQYRFEG